MHVQGKPAAATAATTAAAAAAAAAVGVGAYAVASTFLPIHPAASVEASAVVAVESHDVYAW